jgi:hypothetical protein
MQRRERDLGLTEELDSLDTADGPYSDTAGVAPQPSTSDMAPTTKQGGAMFSGVVQDEGETSPVCARVLYLPAQDEVESVPCDRAHKTSGKLLKRLSVNTHAPDGREGVKSVKDSVGDWCGP